MGLVLDNLLIFLVVGLALAACLVTPFIMLVMMRHKDRRARSVWEVSGLGSCEELCLPRMPDANLRTVTHCPALVRQVREKLSRKEAVRNEE